MGFQRADYEFVITFTEFRIADPRWRTKTLSENLNIGNRFLVKIRM